MSDIADQKQLPGGSDTANSFIAILGILSALSYPIFQFVWEGNPIGIGKYAVLLALFVLAFLFLVFGAERFKPSQRFFASYINWVMPALCVIACLAVAEVVSVPIYAVTLIAIHSALLSAHLIEGYFSLDIKSFRRVNESVVNLLPVGYGSIVWIWVGRTYNLFQSALLPAWITVSLGVTLTVFFLWLLERWRKTLKPSLKWMVYLLVVLAVIGLVYRPELFVDRYHYNYFMAPINDVFHGRIPYVNTTSQYGMGLIYALALAFSTLRLPLGYEGLALFVTVAYILQYLWLAFLLWKTTDNLMISVFGLLSIVYFNYLAVFWQSMIKYPGGSPFRYGFTYLLLGVALLNVKYPKRYLQTLELVLVGIVSTWSLEAFIYTLLSLDAFYFVNDVLFAQKFLDGIKKFAGRLAIQMGVILASWTAVYLCIYGASGKLPDLRIYLEYFTLHINHIPEETTSLTVHMLSTGSSLLVYLFSIFAVLFDRLRRKNFLPAGISSIIVGMSVAGIVHYVYYFVYYLDIGLALLCIPMIFLLAIWAAIIRQGNVVSPALQKSILGALAVTLMLNMVMASPNFYRKFSKSLLYAALVNQNIPMRNPYHISPSNKSVEILAAFIQRYANNQEQIAIFADSNDQAEVLFLTGKIEMLGMSDAHMSAVSSIYSELLLNNARSMAGKPSYIFYCSTEKCLLPLQQEAYQIMIAQGNYRIVDEKQDIVVLKKED